MTNKKKKRGAIATSTASRAPIVRLYFPPDGLTWMEGGQLHALVPGQKPSEAELRKITAAYQQQIRKSPLFRQWVKQFGKKKAVECSGSAGLRSDKNP